MSELQLSIIIPTYNRPHLLPRAVKSALSQTIEGFEVIVVDDGSTEPPQLPEHPQLRYIQLPENRGGAAARNIATETAKGRWITYLDDDDELLPQMAEVSLRALAHTRLPPPVGVLCALEVVTPERKVIKVHSPPTLTRGSHFCLEEIEPGMSFFSKQTLMVEREVLLGIGGFDASFSSRIHTELFLRLNPVCSLLGLPVVTYRLYQHQETRVSSRKPLRQTSFNRLIQKHHPLFLSHPKMFANFLYDHALMSWQIGQWGAALKTWGWAMNVHPSLTLTRLALPLKETWWEFSGVKA